MYEMFRIKEVEERIKVPCEPCMGRGIIDKRCHRCGGKGIHHKTIKIWKVLKNTIDIVKIDRKEKELRYWICQSEYYPESALLVHFNKEDAQKECDKRNQNIACILKIAEINRKIPNEMKMPLIHNSKIIGVINSMDDESVSCQLYRKTCGLEFSSVHNLNGLLDAILI